MRTGRAMILAACVLVATLVAATNAAAVTNYTSPTYGYTVSLPDEWTVESERSEDGVDVLRFTNGPIVAFLTGFPSEFTPAECIEDMVATIQDRPGHANFAFARPIEVTGSSATAVIGYTFITAAGEQLDGRDRITCWSLEEAGAMVRLDLLLLADNIESQQPAIEAIESEVNNAVLALQAEEPASPEPAESPTSEPTATEEPTVEPTATEEPTVEPTATETATVEPSPTETATIEPTPTETAAVEPSPTETATVEASPTETATAEPTATEAATETATAEPTATETATVEPTATPSATAEPSPTEAAPSISGVDASGTSYTSPAFGYSLSWDDTWSVVDGSTDPAGDYLRITNGTVTADVISEAWDPAFTGSCFDLIVDFYLNHPDYSEVLGVEDSASRSPDVWDTTGAIALTYTDPASGDSLELVNYIACSIDEERNIVVSLEQWVSPESAPGQLAAMDALRANFTLE